jgi:hypothetical protein
MKNFFKVKAGGTFTDHCALNVQSLIMELQCFSLSQWYISLYLSLVSVSAIFLHY